MSSSVPFPLSVWPVSWLLALPTPVLVLALVPLSVCLFFFLSFLNGCGKRGKFFAAMDKPFKVDLKLVAKARKQLYGDNGGDGDGDSADEEDAEAGNASLKERFSASKVPPQVDYIIIGGGTSGLAAAVALSKLGEKVLVLEQNAVAGGGLHTFVESKCEFDTGFHYVGATSRSTDLLKQMCCKELPIRRYLHYDRIIWHDESYVDVRGPEDTWMKCIKTQFPKESALIDAYAKKLKWAEKFCQLSVTCAALFPDNVSRWIKYFLSKIFSDVHGKSTHEVCESLGIKAGTPLYTLLNACDYNVGATADKLPFVIHTGMVREYLLSGAYYPVNGVRDIVQSEVNVITQLGNRVLVKATVENILLHSDGSVRGVRVRSGSSGVEILCKKIISSAGIMATLRALPESARWTDTSYRPLAPYDDSNAFACNVYMAAFEYQEEKDKDEAKDEHKEADGQVEANAQTSKSVKGIVVPTYNMWLYDEKAEFAGFLSAPSQKQAGDGVPLKRQSFIVCLPSDVPAIMKYRVSAVKRSAGYEDYKKPQIEATRAEIYKRYPQLKAKNVKLVYESLGTPLTNETYLGRFGTYGRPVNMEYKELDLMHFYTPVKGLFMCGQDIMCPGVFPSMLSGMFAGGKAAGLLG